MPDALLGDSIRRPDAVHRSDFVIALGDGSDGPEETVARKGKLELVERLRDGVTTHGDDVPLRGLITVTPSGRSTARLEIDGQPIPVITRVPGAWLSGRRPEGEAA